MDENIERAITLALRQAGVDVITSQGDAHRETPDPIVFVLANALANAA
jgi:hypothetical protein